MSPYRESSKPAQSDRFITLPVTRARRFILGPCLWFMAIWFLVFVLAGIVQPLATGEDWWKLALGLLAWPLFPWAITRALRLESVLIGTQSLHRVGFLRERSVRWDAVTDVRRFARRVNRRTIPLIGVDSAAGELVVAELAVDDPQRVLDWALAAASAGRLQDIDERVRAEGRPAGRARWYVLQVLIALALSVLFGSYLYKDAQRRHVERTMRATERLPLTERIAALAPIFEDTSLPGSTRCRAGTSLKYARARAGDAAGAFETCARQSQLACAYRSPAECSPFAALRDAGVALDAGDPARALGLLEGWTSQGPERGAIEVPALVALGRMDAAREASARCLRLADESEPTTAALVARCRLAP